MLWNLVDHLSNQQRRAFYMPLASTPPGKLAQDIRSAQKDQFEPSDISNDPQGVILNIRVTSPAGGDFANDGELPDPAIRLHAMGAGILIFKNADKDLDDRLILEMRGVFELLEARPERPPWWQRWVEAGCIPLRLIYEKVNKGEIETLLRQLAPGKSFLGLSLPLEVKTAKDTETFITDFLAGKDGFRLSAIAGAVIGTAARDPKTSTTANAPRILRLHAQYEDHTDANPHPMNPREFFHLLFGNDSQEFNAHPLLQKINEAGLAQPGLESKTMRLRPPLRTYARVMWEAEIEIQKHSTNWSVGGSLGPTRFFNTHPRPGNNFSAAAYNDLNKCNLFASDICLRAGFRINVHLTDGVSWHYTDANSYCNNIHRPPNLTPQIEGLDLIPVKGRTEDRNVTWAYKLENWLRNEASNNKDLRQVLNTGMTEEGRCYILAAARPRKFRNKATDCNNKKKAFCVCKQPTAIGHIVIVKTVDAQPILLPEDRRGDGLQSIRVTTVEARGSGAGQRSNGEFTLGGQAASADAVNGFIRVHIFELHPGLDPDTQRGLRDLNVRNENRSTLRTDEEKASDTKLTHNTDGTKRDDNMCCKDQWPDSNDVLKETCA